MSRIGKQIITIKDGIDIKIDQGELDQKVTVKGPRGELTYNLVKDIKIEIKDNQVVVTRPNEELKALHGTVRSLINNMVIGVTDGYKKNLEIKGVGYKAELKGNDLVINIGYSHPVTIKPMDGIKFTVADQVNISVEGINKQVVGQMAALIREVRKPEPYKGKGIKYKDEQIRRKAGKAAKAK